MQKTLIILLILYIIFPDFILGILDDLFVALICLPIAILGTITGCSKAVAAIMTAICFSIILVLVLITDINPFLLFDLLRDSWFL